MVQDLLGRPGFSRLEGFVCSLHQSTVNGPATDGLHHGQMLSILVRLEQGIPCEQLNQNASNAPDVARVGPIQAQDHLWCSIVPCRHYRAVVFVFKRGRAKVNEADVGLEQHTSLGSLTTGGSRDRWNFAVVCKGLVCGIVKENVLWFQVCVHELEIMQNYVSMSVRLGHRRKCIRLQATLVSS